ncbi:MAG: uroporphyrinogen-III synthase [Chloroflexi bacterium]|nr:uroporphyrinogen-III synthase [Chloroflexota bacterium]
MTIDDCTLNHQSSIINRQSSIMNRQSSIINKRIVITRSAAQAALFKEKLTQLGAESIVFPAIELVPLPPEPLNEALTQFEQYNWIVFTSVNAVNFFFRRVENFPEVLSKVATVGSATTVALQSRHIPINYTPDTFTGAALAAGLGDLTGQRILLPRARLGRPQIVELLRSQGAEVDDVALYDTVTAVPAPAAIAQLEQGFDVVTFTSPSSVRNFLKIIGELEKEQSQRLSQAVNTTVIACIGPSTADEARLYSLPVAVMPKKHTIDGLAQAIERYFEKRET